MPINNLEGEIYDVEGGDVLNSLVIPGGGSGSGSVLESIRIPLPGGEAVTFSADSDGIIRQDNSLNLPK